MRFEVLHTEGCSGYEATVENLREVLAEGGAEADAELVEVRTNEEARRLRFPGSPTVRADGRATCSRPPLARREEHGGSGDAFTRPRRGCEATRARR